MIKKIVLLLIFNILFFLIIFNIEKEILQKQNILNINAVKECVKQLNPNNLEEFKSHMEICAKKQRNLGVMGDMFALLPENQKVIWDASADCKLDENKSYLTEGYICDLFFDKGSCKELSNNMKNNKSGCGIWYFNEDPEYINFDTYLLKEDNKSIPIRIASGGEKKDMSDIFKPLLILIIIFDILMLFLIKSNKNE